MSAILDRINRRFLNLKEETGDISWKDPNSPNYDRQWAEDALYHTIGPLTDSPRWAGNWTSPSQPVPGFTPGSPAPQWTPEELVMAFAGDPNLLFSGRDNPRAPRYGNKGGSPLFRTARKVARYYARGTDPSFIEDMYSNGFISLLRMMQPGADKSQAAFISYAIRQVQSAMEHGIGGEKRTSAAAGFENELGQRGLKSLLDEVDPNKVREAASVVKGEYRGTPSHDKNDDNPFGVFSSAYYQTTMEYADALESGNEEQIAMARENIQDLIGKIDDYSTKIGGASTGLGQAIDTPDRKTSIGIASMDAPAGSGQDDTKTMAGNITAGGDEQESAADTETIKYILDIAINHDLGKILATSEKYNAMAADLGAKKGKIGGPMGANELRYIIRTLGPSGADYPGKGVPRSNTSVPRDGRKWWQPGEDPEIEPLPTKSEATDPIFNGLWHSIWSRSGHESMGPTAIADEMTQEVKEFNHYGIETARSIKTKEKKGVKIEEAVSKVAIANTLRSATVKLKIITDIYSGRLGLDENVFKGDMIAEDVKGMDDFDKSLVVEAAERMIRKINKALVFEKSPPGWKGSVKAMKKHDDIDNPYALAWSMKKKGAEPHYKDKDGKPEKKKEHKEDRMKPVDALVFEDEQ